MSVIACIGVIPTLFLNVWAILAGKFVFGLASGAIIVASSIYLNETVPVEKSATFDFTTNFGVILGITICLVLGLGLPDASTDPEAAKSTQFWRVINGMPILFGTISLLNWLCFFRFESLKFCFTMNDHESAKDQIKRIYSLAN